MDKVIIYISFDSFEFANYYHLIINDEKKWEYCREDELKQMFIMIKENAFNFDLYIVKEIDASLWNYIEDFNSHEIELNRVEKYCKDDIIKEINKILCLEKEENELEIVFEGKAFTKKNDIGIQETLNQAEEILKYGGTDMTELARIIKEKYERMNNNE